MSSRNPIAFQLKVSIIRLLKVSIIRLWNEQRPLQEISEIFGISQQRVISIVGEIRLVALYFFNEGWTNVMVANTLRLSVDTVAILRLTLSNVICVRGCG